MISKKILITTDFSEESKAGLCFAIQLASQDKYDLTFFHSFYVMIPTSWNNVKHEAFAKEKTKIIQEELHNFVEKVYRDMNIVQGDIKCVIKSSVYSQTNIREYAAENNFSFICISTRGAGKFKRLFGTNTANLISYSDVPVIAVPYDYKTAKIESILYTSDLINVDKELKRVVDFAKPLKLKVELLHFTSPLEILIDSKIIEVAVKKLSKYEIKMNIKNADYAQTLVSNIESAIKKTKPSMMIMFTEQNRTLFQKLFSSSKSAEYTFDAKVPLLVFNKS